MFFVQPYRREIIKDRWIRNIMTKITGKHYSYGQSSAPSSVTLATGDRQHRKNAMVSPSVVRAYVKHIEIE